MVLGYTNSSHFATDSQSTSTSWCGPQSGPHDQIFITVGRLQFSCRGAPSLTRGRVCNLLIQFAVTFQSKSRETHNHILLSHFRLLGSLLVAPYDSHGYNGDWPIGLLKLKLSYDRWSVGQSALVSSCHLEPMTRFLFSVWQLLVSYCGAPSLTRGWVCNLLIQLLLGLARAVTLGCKSHRTQTIFYCLIWDSPNVEVQVPIFISPRNRVAQSYPRALGSLFIPSYDS
jgi:hypothetical protein